MQAQARTMHAAMMSLGGGSSATAGPLGLLLLLCVCDHDNAGVVGRFRVMV